MTLRFAILGLLSITPMSGYELKKVVDSSVGHFWSTDRSQIYRTLAGLVEDGLAERETVVQEGRPNRQVHHLTARGAEALDAWLASPLDPEVSRKPFLARAFFADRLTPAEVVHLFERRRDEAVRTLEALEAIEVPTRGDLELGEFLRLATRDNGIAHARAELAWADQVLDQLRVWKP